MQEVKGKVNISNGTGDTTACLAEYQARWSIVWL